MKDLTDIAYSLIDELCGDCPKKKKCEEQEDYAYDVISCMRKRLKKL